jgi:hypothetical protein
MMVKARVITFAPMSPLDRRAILLCICMAVSLAFVDHRVRREKYREHVVTEYIPSVLAGTSGAPAKYRVLMPFALDAVSRRTGAGAYTVFLWSELLFLTAALVLTHVYLRRWYPPAASLGGTAALAALLPLAFTNTWAHPDTFPDLCVMTAGCLAIASRRDALLGAVLFVGMFNRETTGFLAILWAVDRFPHRRVPGVWWRAALLFGVCATVYVGLRWIRGFEGYQMWMVPMNLQYTKVLPAGFDPYTRVAGFLWLPLVAIPGWLACAGARRPGAPWFLTSGCIVAGLFVIVAWLFAAIIETRVFVPALPLLLPAAVAAFTDPRQSMRR